MSKFYEFNQNNTGGSFEVNEMVCHRVFIQANNDDEANKIALNMGIYFDGVSGGLDCGCCGDRWHESTEYDAIEFPKEYGNQMFNSIEEYAQNLANNYGGTKPDARIFYADGKKVSEVFTVKKAD